MVLSDRDILGYLEQRIIGIDPLPNDIQPASVDLHLHATFRQIKPGLFDPTRERSPDTTEISTSKQDGYVLNPGQFLLGATMESIRIPAGFVGIITGKSSLARIGLQVEAAGYADPGWDGNLTLELFNMGPLMIVLRARMPICQIRFEKLSTSSVLLYGDRKLRSHYLGSLGPVGGRFDPPGLPSPIVDATVVDATVVEAEAIPLGSGSGHDVARIGQDTATVPAVLEDKLDADAVDPLL